MPKPRTSLLVLTCALLAPLAAAGGEDAIEWLAEAGIQRSHIHVYVGSDGVDRRYGATGLQLALGARRSVDADRRHWLGMRFERAGIDGATLLAWRAVDYQYRPSWLAPLAFGAFAGVARLDTGAPAFGYYLGAGASWQRLVAGLDLSLDLRYGDTLGRDKLLPGDPPSVTRPDLFYYLTGAVLSLGWRF